MKLNKIEILNALTALNVPYEARGAILSLALARVIAYGLPLPANGAPSEAHQTRDDVLKMICEINESVVVDVDAVMSAAINIWNFRCRVAYDALNPAVSNFLDALLRAGESSLPSGSANLLTTYADDKDLVNALSRAVWNHTDISMPTVVPVEAAIVATEDASCTCPSLECHAHSAESQISQEGFKDFFRLLVSRKKRIEKSVADIPGDLLEMKATVKELTAEIAQAKKDDNYAHAKELAVELIGWEEEIACQEDLLKYFKSELVRYAELEKKKTVSQEGIEVSQEGFKEIFDKITSRKKRIENNVKEMPAEIAVMQGKVKDLKAQLAQAKKDKKFDLAQELSTELISWEDEVHNYEGQLDYFKAELVRYAEQEKKRAGGA